MRSFLHQVVGALVAPPRRDERGLSQSTENAILLAGAVTIAVGVVTAITLFVNSRLPTP